MGNTVRRLPTWLLTGLLLLASAGVRADLPQMRLEVALDPASRQLTVIATLTGLDADAVVTLAPALRPSRWEVAGRVLPLPAAPRGNTPWRFKTPGGRGGPITLAYQGRLADLADLDHRQVLGALPPMASAEGSYLPAGSGWHPQPGTPFAYRLTLRLPPGQMGLAPGRLVRETTDEGYTAEYDFPHPAEGIELMAGPYTVSERSLTLDSGKTVRLRTWFHGELAELADGYLADSAAYIQRYSRLIGDYPYAGFAIVSSPLPTGFGMPGLTYLGREVLRLPFIRATSLGHEVLHNWWGNGVAPDWARGNWSEGLTTFLADYAYQEAQSPEAAREMRLGWLRNLAAVPPGEDSALRAFTSRQHGISSIVGYDKAAMVFLMLRDLIGEAAFNRGLRLLWERHRHGTAAWADLQRAFGTAAGSDLSAFFDQWVTRPGAPRLRLAAATGSDVGVRVTLAQDAPPYALRVPLRLLTHPERTADRLVELAAERATLTLATQGLVQAVELDPDYRLWRRLDAARLPPILREVFVAPRAGLVLADADSRFVEAARALAERVLDAAPSPLAGDGPGLPGQDPALLVASHAAVDGLLRRLGLPPRPHSLSGQGSAQVWAGRDDGGRPYAVVSVRDRDALVALHRPLPHYGRQSWLSFEGAKAMDKGVWPPRPERVAVAR